MNKLNRVVMKFTSLQVQNTCKNVFKNQSVAFSNSYIMKKQAQMNYISNFSFAKVGKKKQQKIELESQKKELNEQLDKEIDLNIPQSNFESELQSLKDELKKIQVGRLTPQFFDKYSIPAYGEKQSINELAQISPKNETTVVLNVYDESIVDAIYKTLENSGEQFQLKREDKNIQIILLGGNTKEAKQASVKEAVAKANKTKSQLKNIRHKSIDNLKPYKKVSSEDVIRNAENEIQEMYTDFVKQCDDIIKKKESDLMSA